MIDLQYAFTYIVRRRWQISKCQQLEMGLEFERNGLADTYIFRKGSYQLERNVQVRNLNAAAPRVSSSNLLEYLLFYNVSIQLVHLCTPNENKASEETRI